MSNLATYARSGSIGRITIDDGKANVMSIGMLAALHAAFDEAEKDGVAVVLSAKGKNFSAGFDLKVFAAGTAADFHTMLKSGAELALRLLSFRRPIVAACHGNTYPMGAFLILSSDFRIAAEGAYKIGMNEVAIGLVVPSFAVEIARQRLTPSCFNRTVVTGEMFEPAEAVTAGFFDRVVPAADLDAAAMLAAENLSRLDMAAHAATKLRARAGAIAAIRAAIDSEITLKYAEQRVALRDAAA